MRSREGIGGSRASSGSALPRVDGELVQALSSPHGDVGFVVPAAAFRSSTVASGVAGALDAILAEAAVTADPADCERLRREAAELVNSAGPSAGLVAAVADVYPGLGIEDFGPARVVVQAVDRVGGPERSEPVRGLPAVLAAIVDRWADGVRCGRNATTVLVRTASRPPC
jgi:hypothetical protein